jgi:3',5'-cyclic AMP phosphodiesterase CpdA
MGKDRFSIIMVCIFIALTALVFSIAACNDNANNIPPKTEPQVTWPAVGRAVTGMILGDVAIIGGYSNPSGTFAWTFPGEPVGQPGTRSFSMTFTPDNITAFYTISRFVFIVVENINAVNIGTGEWPVDVLTSFNTLISNNESVILFGDRTINSGSLTLHIPAEKTVMWIANLTYSGHSGTVVEVAGTTPGTLHILSGFIKSNSSARSLYNSGLGNIKVSGGFISSGSGSAIHNKTGGTITIIGGEVSSESGSAILNTGAGLITISQAEPDIPTLITSANICPAAGTITINDTDVSTSDRLVISGGTIQNTAKNANVRAIHSSSAGSIHISGAATRILATDPGARAIIRAADTTGAVNVASDVTAENIKNRGAEDWIIETEYWVKLADTHIDQWIENAHLGNNPFDNFTQANNEILAGIKPKGFIIIGDAASFHGRVIDYQRLKPFLDQITAAGIPVYVLMGNHDRLENFKAVAPDYVFDTSRNWQASVVEGTFANWFLLDSYVDLTGNDFGRFEKEQLEWLAAELDKRTDKPAILVAHHHISSQIQDLEQFWNIVRTRRQVKAYIHGHAHMYRHSVMDNVHLISLPALGWGPWNVARSPEPVGWTVATVHRYGIDLRLHTVNSEHQLNRDLRKFNWLR